MLPSPLLLLSFLLLALLSLSFTSSQQASSLSSFDFNFLPFHPPSVVTARVDQAGEVTLESHPMAGALPPHLSAGVDAVVEEYVPSNSSHTFHAMQSDSVFTMELMTQTAPWSARIQPALLYQHTPVLYRNWQSNVQVSTGDHWLIMFEGSLSRLTNDSETSNENDVWASMDDGQTWDLIAGVSRYGSSGVVASRAPNTFPARGGSSNCEDPASDRIYSIAGYRYNLTSGRTMYGTTAVWQSFDGKAWATFGGNENTWPQPNRYFSSCDVDINGHVFSLGGITINPTTGVQSLLNDVWNTAQGGWTRVATAPWAARAEHLTLIASNTPIGREVIYVIGGSTGWQGNGAIQTNSNDVWASSDQGVTWRQLVANGQFGHFLPRWGHAGVVTDAGVIILFGGSNSPDGTYYNTYSYRDVWASFNGGSAWHSCRMPEGPDAARQFIRTEQGVTINREGRMIIATGYSFDPQNHIRFDYRDVWRTPFSVEDTATIASMCGGASVIPRAGVGMRAWPQTVTPNPATTMILHGMTHRAPWSPRLHPGLLVMEKPVTYLQVKTGLSVSTPPGWLLLYDGASFSENDVWASADNGATWDLIAGISRFGSMGLQAASASTRSFRGRATPAVCEDPASDDVYTLGGTAPGEGPVNDVWYSSNAITWQLQTGIHSFTPPRARTSCDVDDHGTIFVMGGLTNSATAPRLLNDVWHGTNKGQTWTQVATEQFEDYDTMWSPRAEHAVLHHHSAVLGKDIFYVMGGWTKLTVGAGGIGTYQTVNDVWVSSDDGYSWKEMTGANTEEGGTSNMWSKRWGHSAVITQKGILLVMGGADSRTGTFANTVSLKDMWASFDGGYNWHSCKLPQSHDFIRTQQSAQLTADEHLLLASGNLYSNGSRSIDFADVWMSNISVGDPQALAAICGGEDVLPPRNRVGLQVWPGTATTDLTNLRTGLSGVAISAIVFSILLSVAVLAYCVSGYKRTGQWPLPTFLGGRPSAPAVLDTIGGSTDYSAFSFGGEKADTAQADTNGHGSGGTNGEHNAQFLS